MSAVVIAETVRRYVTSIAYWGFLAFIAILAFGTARFNMPGSVWPILVGLLSIIAGCTAIGPEFSSGTLQLILVKPVKRSAYLLSRVTGIVLATWIAAIVGFLAELLGEAVLADEMRVKALTTTLLNTGTVVVLAIALLTLFGSLTRAYFNVAIYLVLKIALSITYSIAALGRRWPFITTALQHITDNLFPEPPRSLDRPWLLLVLSNTAVALLLACLVFRRREVPYGAD